MSGHQDPEVLAINRIRAILKKLPSAAARVSVLQYVTQRAFQEANEPSAPPAVAADRVFAPEGLSGAGRLRGAAVGVGA